MAKKTGSRVTFKGKRFRQVNVTKASSRLPVGSKILIPVSGRRKKKKR